MKTLGRSLVGAKKDRKRRSLVNTPDVLVTGDAADMARKSIYFSDLFLGNSDPFPSCSEQLLSGPSQKGVKSVRQVAFFGLLREGSEKVVPEVVPEPVQNVDFQ